MTHPAPEQTRWISAGPLSDLQAKGQKIFKKNGKQILLIHRDGKTWACNNRCPHEGYPLAEGTLKAGPAGTCTLTCNWHNWKFDLDSGEALVGGDAVRLYPTRTRGGELFVDLADPAPGQKLPAILDNLSQAWDDYDYDRIARELARYEKDGGDLKDVLTYAIIAHHDRYEYGMTHAFGAAADWMKLSTENQGDPARRLITFLEPTAHIAWDALRHPHFPFPEGKMEWNEDAFALAMEAEDEETAIAMIRGAVSAGLGYSDIEPGLARAALAHYMAFGHAAIYVLKVGELITHLGDAVMEPLCLALTRMLIFGRREDLIPEFRGYSNFVESWDASEGAPEDARVKWQDFNGLSAKAVMAKAASSRADPLALFDALLAANAWNFVHFDLKFQRHTGNNISHNMDWLDFTHTVTFANAVRELCTRYPALWPQALLQMACFVGRNTPFVDAELDTSAWAVDDAATFITETKAGLFDHARFEHIVSCHYVKLTVATECELVARPDGPQAPWLIAALNRLLQNPIKRRHVTRTANQALNFVGLEG
jgi:nitrite reductase/ring-hydroxylating ferredoxin subunit